MRSTRDARTENVCTRSAGLGEGIRPLVLYKRRWCGCLRRRRGRRDSRRRAEGREVVAVRGLLRFRSSRSPPRLVLLRRTLVTKSHRRRWTKRDLRFRRADSRTRCCSWARRRRRGESRCPHLVTRGCARRKDRGEGFLVAAIRMIAAFVALVVADKAVRRGGGEGRVAALCRRAEGG